MNRKHLQQLEEKARQLEASVDQRKQWRRRLSGYLEHFLDELPHKPAFVSGNKGEGLENSQFPEEGTPFKDIVKTLAVEVDDSGLNPASSGHLGYIPGGGIYPAALGDFWAAVTNNYAGVYFAGPGAVRMENELIRWMGQLIGYPRQMAGILTSGGSMANLSGIATARDAHQLKGKDFEKTVVYMTEQVHHSINKALRLAGLKEVQNRIIPMDETYKMQSDKLRAAIQQDRRKGYKPWMVVGAAGTTDTGAIDPIKDIGEICEEEDLWFHLDAAYGGFFILSETGKGLLSEMDCADSIVMDPHKGLFLPYGTGALLVKEGQQLLDTHYYTAAYMQDTEKEKGELSPADLSPELSKHFRGMRLWLPLKLFGLTPFRAALEEKLQLARYFYEEIQQIPGFEVGPPPELSVVIYRYIPSQQDPNTFNRRLVDAVQKEGSIFISSTTIEGTVYLRLAVLAFRTHRNTIDLLIKILQEKVREISNLD